MLLKCHTFSLVYAISYLNNLPHYQVPSIQSSVDSRVRQNNGISTVDVWKSKVFTINSAQPSMWEQNNDGCSQWPSEGNDTASVLCSVSVLLSFIMKNSSDSAMWALFRDEFVNIITMGFNYKGIMKIFKDNWNLLLSSSLVNF